MFLFFFSGTVVSAVYCLVFVSFSVCSARGQNQLKLVVTQLPGYRGQLQVQYHKVTDILNMDPVVTVPSCKPFQRA